MGGASNPFCCFLSDIPLVPVSCFDLLRIQSPFRSEQQCWERDVLHSTLAISEQWALLSFQCALPGLTELHLGLVILELLESCSGDAGHGLMMDSWLLGRFCFSHSACGRALQGPAAPLGTGLWGGPRGGRAGPHGQGCPTPQLGSWAGLGAAGHPHPRHRASPWGWTNVRSGMQQLYIYKAYA